MLLLCANYAADLLLIASMPFVQKMKVERGESRICRLSFYAIEATAIKVFLMSSQI